MADLVRYEVWSSYECDAGARLAVFQPHEVQSGSVVLRSSFEDLLTLIVPLAAAAAPSIVLGVVIRRLFADGDFDEWRVHELEDQSGTDGGRLRVVCRGIIFELRDSAFLVTTDALAVSFGYRVDGKNATSVVTDVVSWLPSWWSVGTIVPTVVVSFSLTDPSPLAALQALASACSAAGQSCEPEVVRVGTTGYAIGLPTKVGDAAEVVDVRTGKNLLGHRRARSRETLVNRVYPRSGSSPVLPLSYFRVTSIAGTVIEVRQAETGAGVVGFDGQLDGLYLENEAGGFTLISASVASTSKVTVASAASLTVNGWCRFVADASGTDLVSLEVPGASPVKVAPWDVAVGTVTNLVENPFLSRWPGSASAAPPGWQVVAGTIARNADPAYIRRGEYSALMSAGYQLRTDTVKLAPGRGATYSAKLTFYLVSSTPAVRLYNQLSTLLATATPSGAGWHEVEFTGIATGAATGLYLRIDAGAGSAYVDSAQITWGAAQLDWMQGSAPSLGWTRANMLLADNVTDPTTYSLTLADLQRWNGAEFPYDRLVRGGTVAITDTEMGVVYSARVRELTQDVRAPARSSVVLERLVRTFTRVLVNR